MTDANVAVFSSKRDRWLMVIIAGAMIVMVTTAAMELTHFRGVRLLIPMFMLVVTFFIGWLLLGTRYEVGERELVVRSGPLRWRIPIARVIAVTETRDPISSPALSLDRLQIDYDNGHGVQQVLISPADKSRFIAMMREENPAIRIG